MTSTNPWPLADALRAGPVVLDGGLATQLEAAGHDLSDELWSARLLADAPAAIVAAHRAYLDAGASVITTASYQASLAGFAARGLDGARMLRRSVDLAREAARGYDRPVWIAASVGPYGAVRADGSEYRGNYGLSVDELVAFHRPRLEVLAEAGPDVLALETVPDAREAEALLRALDGIDVPAWLSFTVAGGRTRAGQSLVDAGRLARDHPGIIAVGANCSTPADALAAVPELVSASGKPGVLYPNSGETWDAEAREWRGDGESSAAAGWIHGTARLIGGCCRVGPAAIAALSRRLADSPDVDMNQ